MAQALEAAQLEHQVGGVGRVGEHLGANQILRQHAHDLLQPFPALLLGQPHRHLADDAQGQDEDDGGDRHDNEHEALAQGQAVQHAAYSPPVAAGSRGSRDHSYQEPSYTAAS